MCETLLNNAEAPEMYVKGDNQAGKTLNPLHTQQNIIQRIM